MNRSNFADDYTDASETIAYHIPRFVIKHLRSDLWSDTVSTNIQSLKWLPEQESTQRKKGRTLF